MFPKKLALLCLIVLITACGKAPESVKVIEHLYTAFDFYMKVKPVAEAIIAPELTKRAPTPLPEQRMVDYFAFAKSQGCVRDNDNFNFTWVSIVCRQGETSVRFDEWIFAVSLDELVGKITSPGAVQLTKNRTWVDPAKPDVPLGKLLEFKTADGKAHIFWTVYGKNFSGWADRADGDQAALRQWWEKTGSRHY